MKKTIKFLFFFILLFSLFFEFLGCANPLPPSGGPRDTTSPKIRENYPPNGIINFKDKFIKFRFDKYMDKNSVQQNTTIIPTIKTDFVWSGKELKIKFLEELEENTTYSISLGSEIQDWKGNKLDETFTLIFSTGNTIDSGKILGKLITPEPAGASIFLYKMPIETIKFDTFDITTKKPNYNIQIGSSGSFEIKALKDGIYRLIAVRDKFKNGIYDDGEDEFGAYFEDIVIKQDSVVKIHLKLGPALDRLGPMLYDVVSLNNRILSANFSEPLDTIYISTKAFVVKNAEVTNKDNINLEPESVIISPETGYKLLIYLPAILDTAKKYQLICLLDSNLAVRDTIGNLIRDTASKAIFQPNVGRIDFKTELIKMTLKDSTINVMPEGMFKFVFNAPLIKNHIGNSFKLINLADSTLEKVNVTLKTDNIIIVKPERKLNSDNWYSLVFKTDSIFSIDKIKMKDTTYIYRFKTADIRTYSGISGSLTTNENCNGSFYVILKNSLNKTSYKAKVDNSYYWNFEDVPPGDYEFEVFCDEDGDSKYSYGDVKEKIFSEKFYLPKDKVTLKPRWKIEKYILDIMSK